MRYSRATTTALHPLRLRLTTRSRWVITAVIALTAASWTFVVLSGAQDDRRAWGTVRSTPVATGDLAPGRVITSSDVHFVDRPIALLPNAISESPIGRTVSRTILRNEVIVDERLSGGATTGPAALLDEHSVAFAIQIENATPPVLVGDHVALFAPAETAVTSGRAAGPALQLTSDAMVIAMNDRTVSVAVDFDEAPSVAKALLASSVVIALTN